MCFSHIVNSQHHCDTYSVTPLNNNALYIIYKLKAHEIIVSSHTSHNLNELKVDNHQPMQIIVTKHLSLSQHTPVLQ